MLNWTNKAIKSIKKLFFFTFVAKYVSICKLFKGQTFRCTLDCS